MNTRETLRTAVSENLRGRRVVAVSNREPFIHNIRDGEISCIQPASGLTTALDPVLRATHGLWVAHGSGSADRLVVNARDRVSVPPDNPSYTLRRVWLSPEQERRYYYGFSNQAMWPLCHCAYQQPVFDHNDWRSYVQVNKAFARALAEEIGDQPAAVFIQDYHLALLPRLLKARCPRAIITHFWHIPWPNPEIFRICPWKKEILEGLLGNDVLGFHVRYHCLNFLRTVANALEARIDEERLAIEYKGGWTRVRAFPVSVDYEEIQSVSRSRQVEVLLNDLRARHGIAGQTVGLGVDRLDYTKGIIERLRAVDRFLEKFPDYQGRFTFVQVGVPSREAIAAYSGLQFQIESLVGDINTRYARNGWKPIVYIKQHLPPETLYALYRMADVCVVSSLHDGMNLVAKEYVSARFDEGGVLVLSRFTGAARELDQALIINPYDIEAFAETIRAAIEMDEGEKNERMRHLRDTVSRNNVYSWATAIVNAVANVAAGGRHRETSPDPVEAGRAAFATGISASAAFRF